MVEYIGSMCCIFKIIHTGYIIRFISTERQQLMVNKFYFRVIIGLCTLKKTGLSHRSF